MTWVSIGHYRLKIDRLTSAFTTLLKSQVVDSIICVSIKRVQRYLRPLEVSPQLQFQLHRTCNMKILFGLAFLLCFSVSKLFQSCSIGLFLVRLGYENAKEICSVRSFLPFLLLASFIFCLGIMGCGSPFCSLSYLHVPDKHQWFSLSIFNFIRNVTFKKSLISKCNIRLEINVIVALQFFAFE